MPSLFWLLVFQRRSFEKGGYEDQTYYLAIEDFWKTQL